MPRRTSVGIQGESFIINGEPTYRGRVWNGHSIEGLLLNSRMVQGIFDDLNCETRAQWAYPDGAWDPDRNTREFVAAMPSWRSCGLIAFTINLQGGNPRGYGKGHPWINSAFEGDGSLRADYMGRLEWILDASDELGMIVILGYFYFGQDQRINDEESVIRAAENATDWVIEKGYGNVLIEIGNEVNHSSYTHPIISSQRVDELISLVQRRSVGRVNAATGRLLVSASLTGGKVPPDNIVEAGDFLLLHGNGVDDPDRIRRMVDQSRANPAYRGVPILFNEDDHYDFDKEDNNFVAAVSRRAGWGYFDYRNTGEEFRKGFQTVPCDWRISSDRKRGFFGLLSEMTGTGELEK